MTLKATGFAKSRRNLAVPSGRPSSSLRFFSLSCTQRNGLHPSRFLYFRWCCVRYITGQGASFQQFACMARSMD